MEIKTKTTKFPISSILIKTIIITYLVCVRYWITLYSYTVCHNCVCWIFAHSIFAKFHILIMTHWYLRVGSVRTQSGLLVGHTRMQDWQPFAQSNQKTLRLMIRLYKVWWNLIVCKFVQLFHHARLADFCPHDQKDTWHVMQRRCQLRVATNLKISCGPFHMARRMSCDEYHASNYSFPLPPPPQRLLWRVDCTYN